MRGIFWLLGFLGLSNASAASPATDTAAATALLEARIKAARQVLAEAAAVDHAAGGNSPSSVPPAASLLAQWLNDPDWRNWGNWPNWFNQ